MTFDLVIGNPPYQPLAKGDRGLWARFVHEGNRLLAAGGTLAMIVPHGWMSPTADVRRGGVGILRDVLAVQDTPFISLDPDIGRRAFPGVGQTFTWFVTRALPRGSTAIDFGGSRPSLEVELAGLPMLPRDATEEAISVIRKLAAPGERWGFRTVIMDADEWSDASDEKSETHPFPRLNGNSDHLDRIVWTRAPCPHSGSRKAFIPRRGSEFRVVADGGSLGVTVGNVMHLAPDDDLGSAAVYFGSGIIRWLGSHKFTQFNEGAVLNSVKRMPLRPGLRECDVADHYGITYREMRAVGILES